jgi:pimeloyl-ACP methyl ester carboxylesterase
VSDPNDPIVCLPAALSGGAQWQELRRLWTGRHEIVTPDLAAEGAATPDRPREEMFANLLAQEIELLAALLGERPFVHLVGHSYGGVVACRFAREFPERVRSLTLIEPVCFDLLRHFGPADLRTEVQALKASCRTDLPGRALQAAERFISYWGGASAWATLPPAARERAARGMTKVVVGWEEIWDQPVIAGGNGFRGPVLVLGGTSSPPASRWIARYCAAEILHGSQYEEIEGAGHFAPVTHAAEVVCALERLITGVAHGS